MQRLLLVDTISEGNSLGLRFLDPVRGVSVNDGLVVTARRPGSLGPRRAARISPLSGIYSFHALAELLSPTVSQRLASATSTPLPQGLTMQDGYPIEELRDLLQSYVASPGGDLVISVEDQQGRFLPQMILVSLPRQQLIVVPLFSSPARTPSAGTGVVRGELALYNTQPVQPASWALITVTLGTHTYAGMADARGMFTLFVSYSGAAPSSTGASQNVADPLSWPAVVSIYYQPGKQKPLSKSEPPDLLSLVEQGRANIYDGANPPDLTITHTLKFGEDLVLKTNSLQAQLFINPPRDFLVEPKVPKKGKRRSAGGLNKKSAK